MTTDEVQEVNNRRDPHQNGNPFLYPDTLYIGAVYKGNGVESGDHPFVLVETGHGTQEYMMISLRDGMPANIGGASQPGYFATATERELRYFLSRNDMELVAADAKTYYGDGGYNPDDYDSVEDYVKNKS